MTGYYVIPSSNNEPLEFTGRGSKARALKVAKKLFSNGDSKVLVQRFDDNNPDGYMAMEEIIYIEHLLKLKRNE